KNMRFSVARCRRCHLRCAQENGWSACSSADRFPKQYHRLKSTRWTRCLLFPPDRFAATAILLTQHLQRFQFPCFELPPRIVDPFDVHTYLQQIAREECRGPGILKCLKVPVCLLLLQPVKISKFLADLGGR